jgi:hypothetical protein
VCTWQELRALFYQTDKDGSGEIDFNEFCQLMSLADGGAFQRMVNKVMMDDRLREIMKEKCRPITKYVGELEDQLAKVREERVWMSGLHMTSVSDMVKAAGKGYTGDRSTYLGGGGSPTRPGENALSPYRSARRMMPESDAAGPTGEAAPAMLRPGLRRVFSGTDAVAGTDVSPQSRRRRQAAAGGGSGVAASPPLGRPRAEVPGPWDTWRSRSMPMSRKPPSLHFHEAAVTAGGSHGARARTAVHSSH